jgi:hypothetical protein
LNPNDAALFAQIAAEGDASQAGITYDELQSLSQALQGAQGNYPPALSRLHGYPNYFPQQPHMPHAQMNPPLPPAGASPWPIPSSHSPVQNPYGQIPSFYPGNIPLPYGASQYPLLPNFHPAGGGSNYPTASTRATSSDTAMSSPVEGAEQLEDARAASAEDKRRRNTAASGE